MDSWRNRKTLILSRTEMMGLLTPAEYNGCVEQAYRMHGERRFYMDPKGHIVLDKYPGEEAWAPVFDELNRRKAVVYFHPTGAPCCAAHGIGIPAATLEFPFDTTKAVTSMLFAGTFARCRDIRFIFSHAGGTVPFLAQRIARLQVRPEFKASIPDGVMFELKRLFFDTALSANEFAFSALLKLVAPQQVLFGSDYPFAPETTMTATVKGLSDLGLPPDVLQAIERTNALRLFDR